MLNIRETDMLAYVRDLKNLNEYQSGYLDGLAEIINLLYDMELDDEVAKETIQNLIVSVTKRYFRTVIEFEGKSDKDIQND